MHPLRRIAASTPLLTAAVALACTGLAIELASSHSGEVALQRSSAALQDGRLGAAAAAPVAGVPAGRTDAVRAYALAGLRRYGAAARAFSVALRRDPGNWVLQRDAGLAWLALGRRDRARARLARALALNPRIQIPHGFTAAMRGR